MMVFLVVAGRKFCARITECCGRSLEKRRVFSVGSSCIASFRQPLYAPGSTYQNLCLSNVCVSLRARAHTQRSVGAYMFAHMCGRYPRVTFCVVLCILWAGGPHIRITLVAQLNDVALRMSFQYGIVHEWRFGIGLCDHFLLSCYRSLCHFPLLREACSVN